jgi:predicted dehydrogenase
MRAASAQTSANDKIRFATIGHGIMGTGDTETARKTPGTQLVAVCDIYEGRLTRAKELWGKDIFTTRDYRQVLSRKDVDAVIVATPDHWHAQIAEEAMNAGKDVYVQKPMVQKVEDGHRLIEASKKNGRILQVGSQGVSSVVYQKARELFRAGAIGELNMVEAWIDRNSAVGAWQYMIPADASPQTVDWDRFLGSAPKRPFEPIRLFRWRNYRDYGTGVPGDLFVHLFTEVHFVTGAVGPNRIFASGGTRFWRDGRDVPDLMLGQFDYAKTDNHPAFNLALRVNFECGGYENGGLRLVGSEGVMTIGDAVTVTRLPKEKDPGMTPGSFSKETAAKIVAEHRKKYPVQTVTAEHLPEVSSESYHAPRGFDAQDEHHAVFFDAVRTRKPVVEDALYGLRAAGPAVLSNTSYFEKKIVYWDPVNAKVKA